MEKLEYPLTGYDAQFAEQDAIFERYGEHIHLCIIDPSKFQIDSAEEMEKLVSEFGKLFKYETQERRYQSGEDPEPNLIHIEIDDPKEYYASAVISELEKSLAQKYSLGYGTYPSDDENSAGKLVVKHGMDLEHEQRIAFEFSNTGSMTPKLTVEESTALAMNKIRGWINQ